MNGALVHIAFEAAGYAVGAALLRRAQASRPEAVDLHPGGALVFAGGAVGAAVGAKLLWAAQYASWLAGQPWTAWVAGKTVVGGLLGAWAGVELAKRAVGFRASTGDRLVVPLLVALAIGRLGCVAAGADDHTAGIPTDLPWGMLGPDGVRIHPTALYEAGLAALGAIVASRLPAPRVPGRRFAAVVAAYLLFRVGVDFLKPPYGPGPEPQPELWGALTPIQWAALAGAAVAGLRYKLLHE